MPGKRKKEVNTDTFGRYVSLHPEGSDFAIWGLLQLDVVWGSIVKGIMAVFFFFLNNH